jgi:hypothetical protein
VIVVASLLTLILRYETKNEKEVKAFSQKGKQSERDRELLKSRK